MATKLASIVLADGSRVVVEASEVPARGVKSVGLRKPGDIDFGAALDQVKAAAGELSGAVQTMARPPDSWEITFGIKLSWGAGVIITRTAAEANFSVKMSWNKK